MSGSIHADRIEHSAVKDTVNWFERNILDNYPAYQSIKLSGSAKQSGKKDHGDIDAVICVDGDNLRDAKKAFEKYLNRCTELVKFKGGKHAGEKVQVYGDTITCQVPIQGFEGMTVQFDCNLVLSEKEQEFKVNFLDLSAEKQALISGLVRVALLEGNSDEIFKKLHIHGVPNLDKGQELEFVLNGNGLILRKVTVQDYKETERKNIWISRDWNDVKKLLSGYDLGEDFEKLLDQADKKLKSSRARHRVSGIVKANVNISDGEKDTEKGYAKQRAIDSVVEKLESLESKGEESKNVVALYAGGFKPPHKGHFEDARKLYNKADRLIIFIGPKLRTGIPITAEQSKKIWDIYAKYLRESGKPIEIRLSESSPVQDVFALATNLDNSEYKFLIGRSDSKEDRNKYSELEKGDYPSIQIMKLPTISSKESDKLSASTLRHSIELLKKGDWIPPCLNRDDAKKVLDIVLKPLQQEVLKEEFATKVKVALGKVGTRSKQLDESFTVGPEGIEKVEGKKIQGYIRLSIPPADEFPENPLKSREIIQECVNACNQLSDSDFRIVSFEAIFSNYVNSIQFLVECEVNSDTEYGREARSMMLILFKTYWPTGFELITDEDWNAFSDKVKVTCTGISRESFLSENSTGAPIAPSSILSSENREKLSHFYEKLDAEYGLEFYIKFNQTFILIKCPDQEKLANLYKKLSEEYRNDFNFKNVRDAIQIKTKYKSDWMSFNSDDGSGTYRDNSGNGGFDYMQDQAEHWIEETNQPESNSQTVRTDFDWVKNMASLIGFMEKEGVNLQPLPEIILNKDKRDNSLLAPTGQYNPVDKVITIYIDGRDPIDSMRSGAHELFHHAQQLRGQNMNQGTEKTSKSKGLEELEGEAYREGNLLFRKWLESLGKYAD